MIEFTTTVSKYLVNIFVDGKTQDPIVIWGQFAANVTNTFTSLIDGDFLQDGIFLQD